MFVPYALLVLCRGPNLYGFRLELLLTSSELVVDTRCRLSLLLGAGVGLFKVVDRSIHVSAPQPSCQKVCDTYIHVIGPTTTTVQNVADAHIYIWVDRNHDTKRGRCMREWTATMIQ